MSDQADDTRHLMRILREAMRDPALSGGSALLGELFPAIAEEEAAQELLAEIPAWKVPGLLLSAALLYRAEASPEHPLAKYLANAPQPDDTSFRAAVREALTRDHGELSTLAARHTYQCNPPRRMAVSLVAAATATEHWGPAWHIDVGTASGLGLLLGRVRVQTHSGLGPADASLVYPLELRGAPLDLAPLRAPVIERAIGIDLDPPDLRDPESRAWMRACQFPVAAELGYFDEAVDLILASSPRIERGSATDLLPRIVAEMPHGQPLLVTDTYVSVFMSEAQREELRGELDAIARTRPVVWISINPLVPAGPAPVNTTAGCAIPPELAARNARELFGVVSVTTWPDGQRTPRIVGVTHPGGCWLEWRPDFAAAR